MSTLGSSNRTNSCSKVKGLQPTTLVIPNLVTLAAYWRRILVYDNG